MEEVTYGLHSSSPDKPSVQYWHVWINENGVSRKDRCKLSDFKFESISSDATPSWVDRLSSPGTHVIVMVLPVGWVGDRMRAG